MDLNPEEAAIYSFLAREGATPARTISEKCRIPFSRVYRILHRLQQREMIVSCGKTPKRFALRCKDPALLVRNK